MDQPILVESDEEVSASLKTFLRSLTKKKPRVEDRPKKLFEDKANTPAFDAKSVDLLMREELH